MNVRSRNARIITPLLRTDLENWETELLFTLGANGTQDVFVRYQIPHDMYYGDECIILLTLNSEIEGDFISDWQMVKEGIAWFGEKYEHAVHVESTTSINNTDWILYH